jgi:FkbM family methyltransferase
LAVKTAKASGLAAEGHLILQGYLRPNTKPKLIRNVDLGLDPLMNSIPLWLRILRIYCHYSPVQRGKIRLIDWTYRNLSIPHLFVKAKLDRAAVVKLNLQIWVDYNIYCWGIYEYYLARFFQKQLKSDTIFFDVGAYIGQYAQLATYAAPKGKVYAFEPNQESVARLNETIQENHFLNIEVVPKGVGAGASSATFYVGQQPSQSSLVASHTNIKQTQEISIISLDTFCEERGIKQVDIIKIDVEEAEDDVIKGAMALLEAARPLIILEVGRKAIESGDPESLRQLRSLNYKIFALNRTRLQSLPEKLLPGQAVIAVPIEKVSLLRT